MKFTIFNKFIFLFFSFIQITIFAQTSDTTLTLIGPNGGEYWTTGSFPIVTWKSSGISALKIELSLDNGLTWEQLSVEIAAKGSFSKWKIPDYESDQCLIKISSYNDPNIFDVSDSTFKITTDSSQIKIVVLGSSTAAGVGANPVDSAWVNRYRTFLTQKNTTYSVINLAVGGYTTYDLMPTGYVPPEGRPTPKVGHNITTGVSYNPNAMIINLPSNDVTQGFSISEQLTNYDTIVSKAYALKIPVWVSTTQPRNLTDAQRQLQKDMRDSTYVRFGDYAIDFWTDLANEDGTINPIYNSGDGVHLNNAGHKILFERVLAKLIPEQIVIPTSVDLLSAQIPSGFSLEQNYPNPFNPLTNIQFNLPYDSFVSLKVYNILGQEITTLVNQRLSAGIHKTVWDAANFAAGPYFYVIQADNYFQTKKMLLIK